VTALTLSSARRGAPAAPAGHSATAAHAIKTIRAPPRLRRTGIGTAQRYMSAQ
jgi:hypothetical protein